MEQLSSWLGPIHEEQLQRALQRFGLGTFVRAEPTGTGLGNQTCFVTSTTGSFVLRGKPLFPGQLATERFFARYLHERAAISVPWPYYYDPSAEIFGWPYALMPRLPGIAIADLAALPPADRVAIVSALATGLAGLHDVAWSAAGQYDPRTDAIEELRIPYRAWVTQRIRKAINRVREEDAEVTPPDVEWVERLLREAEPALRTDFQPCFVMHDFHHNNVVFARNQSAWEVCGVFDLSEGYVGDGEADLARQTRGLLLFDPTLARVFVQTYLLQRSRRPGFEERFAVYMLDDLLAGWIYARRMGWRDPTRSLRELSEPLTSAAANLL